MNAALRRLVVSLVIASLSAAFAGQRALLVGVNAYTNAAQLQGCVNDIEAVKRVLIDDLKFDPNDIKVLLDGDATRVNILAALNDWLAAGTKAGDTALFYFSGHGSFMRPDPARENRLPPDRRFHQTICPVDVVPPYDTEIFNPPFNPTMISDVEVGDVARKMADRKVVVVYDSCFSGGGVKGISRDRFLPPRPSGAKGLTLGQVSGSSLRLPDTFAFVSAAGDEERASDNGLYKGKTHGAFTASILRSIDRAREQSNGSWQSKVSFASLVAQVRSELTTQHPDMLGAPSLLNAALSSLFLGGSELLTISPTATPVPTAPASVTVYSTLGSGKKDARGVFGERGRIGRSVQFAINSPVGGFLYLVELKSGPNGSDQARLLYPAPGAALRIGAREKITLPRKGEPAFMLEPPSGPLRVVAMVMPEPLANPQRMVDALRAGGFSRPEVRESVTRALHPVRQPPAPMPAPAVEAVQQAPATVLSGLGLLEIVIE